MKQLYFDFYNPSYQRADFIVTSANYQAMQALDLFMSWPSRRLLIVGENGSGKTHLAGIWQKHANAIYVDHGFAFQAEDNLIIDNLLEYEEEFLFYLINFAHSRSLYLLMLTDKLPIFHLPDLQSRINATSKILLKAPDEELCKILLVKQLMDEYIVCDKEVVEYIMPRIERSYLGIQNATKIIASNIKERNKKLTVAWLAQSGVIDGLC